MKNARFLTLIIFFILLVFWIYFNAIKNGVKLFDISFVLIHVNDLL